MLLKSFRFFIEQAVTKWLPILSNFYFTLFKSVGME